MTAVTKDRGRQTVLLADIEVTYDQLPTGVATEVIDLPVGAVVVDGGAFVVTADNGGTSVVLDVGDGDVGDLFVTDLDAKTANECERFDATEIGKKYASGGAITATRTEGGTASSAGKVRIWASYYIDDRTTEVQTH